VQVLQAPDLLGVRAVPVRAGRLQDGRKPLDGRVREERAEALAQLALEDARMPVPVRPERGGGVVHVEAAQPVEPDPLVDVRERRGVDVRIGDVHA
jgi:hypothetical protein